MLRGIWGDPERYRATYWGRFDGKYFAGDGAKRDDDGYFWLLGRVDDVMLISGHNISTAEVEHALVGHPAVAEAAVVGRTDATTGQAIAAFVILRAGQRAERRARSRSCATTSPTTIGPIAKPKSILFTEELPKTRSGKIMRRLLKDVSEDHALGDTTTLADPSVVEGIKARYLAQATATRSERDRRPEHWTWRDGQVEPGPAAVIDIDGVLSDATTRQHYLEAPRRDWRAFFDACGEDPVIEEVKVLLDLLDPDLRIVLLTARPERLHHLTEAWLRALPHPVGRAPHARRGATTSSRGTSSSRRCGSCARTASSCASRSRTTAATWRCSAAKACRASTSTPATTTDVD